MAWWRKGWTGVLGSVFALAGCSSDSPPSTTVALPASTTRPAGFGGTLPAATTSLPSTVPPTAPPATTAAAVSTTSVSTTDEAALRARVLEYDRAFREELLHMPNPNYDRLRAFHVPDKRAALAFDALESLARSNHGFRLNSPDQYRVVIERLDHLDSQTTRVAVCASDNIVEVATGPDGSLGTPDDTVVDDSVGVDRVIDDWSLTEGRWEILKTVEAVELDGNAKCAAPA